MFGCICIEDVLKEDRGTQPDGRIPAIICILEVVKAE